MQNFCIFCLKSGDLSDEHVIPKALGGYYRIRAVCRTCNSWLGSKIDAPFLESAPALFLRERLQLRGHSGTIPDPFAKARVRTNHPDIKARIERDKDGSPYPLLLPNVLYESLGSGTRVTVYIDDSQLATLPRIVRKIANKTNVPVGSIKMEEVPSDGREVLVSVSFPIDLNFFLCLIKIAYEFACDVAPAYIHTPSAEFIRGYLREANFSPAHHSFFFFGNGSVEDPRIGPVFSPILLLARRMPLDSYLMLSDSPHGLLCLIHILDTFAIVVRVCDEPGILPSDVIIGINSGERKCFSKYELAAFLDSLFCPPVVQLMMAGTADYFDCPTWSSVCRCLIRQGD